MKDEDPALYHDAWRRLCTADGIIVPGGFGERGFEGKVLAANWVRPPLRKKGGGDAPVLGLLEAWLHTGWGGAEAVIVVCVVFLFVFRDR